MLWLIFAWLLFWTTWLNCWFLKLRGMMTPVASDSCGMFYVFRYQDLRLMSFLWQAAWKAWGEISCEISWKSQLLQMWWSSSHPIKPWWFQARLADPVNKNSRLYAEASGISCNISDTLPQSSMACWKICINLLYNNNRWMVPTKLNFTKFPS